MIRRRIEPLEVALGHLAKFTCEIHSAPNVRFQWFKAGREIYESDKCSIRSANYVTTLEILRTQVVDCGEYTCKASNEYGSVSCTARGLSHRHTCTLLLDPGLHVWGLFAVDYVFIFLI